MIYVGNCLDWLVTLDADSIDVALTDPPYSEHVHAKSMRGGTVGGGARAGLSGGLAMPRALGFVALTPELQTGVAVQLARVTKRWILAFTCPENISTWIEAFRGAGLEYVRTMVWTKPNGTPQFTGDRPAAAWEAIVVAHRPGRKRWNGGGMRGCFFNAVEQRDRLHTTQKPLPLMMHLVELFTEPGELVIDPFAGSGTTGVACLRRGRRFAGAELDAAMASTATERLEAERDTSTLDARRAGQLGLLPRRIA